MLARGADHDAPQRQYCSYEKSSRRNKLSCHLLLLGSGEVSLPLGLPAALGGETGIAEELGVDALEGHVPLRLGLLDAVAVVLARLVVRRVVLGLGPARDEQAE